MSGRFEKWEPASADRGETPDPAEILDSVSDFFNDRELTQDQAEALDAASSRPPANVKTRELPSRKGADRGEIPDLFIDYGNPCGHLPKSLVILQHHDHWFNEIQDKWVEVDKEDLGKWGDEVFGPHVHLYGSYYRFSDAIHPSLFEAEHGRPKPRELWHGSCTGPDRSNL